MLFPGFRFAEQCTLLVAEHLGVVGLELFDARVGQRVMQHLLNYLIRYRGNIGPGERAVVTWMGLRTLAAMICVSMSG